MGKFLILLLLGLLLQCTTELENPELKVTNFNKDFQLSTNQEMVLQENDSSNTNKLQVSLGYIKDSRCPEDSEIRCVWAGHAKVSLVISGPDHQSQEVDLCLGDCFIDNTAVPSYKTVDSVVIKVSDEIYTVLLKDILPYNSAYNNIPDNEKTALLEIKASKL